ncbi:MAG: SMI1/KNR4 family protein [Sandaracinaceae bacterium]|nr:SMI1/KNR4 family protein [Sandaracinaceae bacterium]
MAPSAKALKLKLDELLRQFEQLDFGMRDGRVVTADEVRALQSDGMRAAESALAALGRAAAEKWIRDSLTHRVPKSINVARLRDFVATISELQLEPVPAAPVSVAMQQQIAQLQKLAASSPDRHVLNRRASPAQVRAREAELGVSLPDDLRALYEFADGFALFCDGSSADAQESPFRLLPLLELQYASDDDDPSEPIAQGGSTEDLIHHPQRVRVFDLGNGDYLSCLHTARLTIWIDEHVDGPTGIVARSLAVLLETALSSDRIDSLTGRWTRAFYA